VARGIFGLGEIDAALLLARFMIAIPLGAVAGGWLAGRFGYRWVAMLGLLAAAAAFLRMSGWQAGELQSSLLGIPDATITLALCGLGFGLVIAPVAAAILDRARDREHGLASSMVVLARSVGMLLGLSALAAFGIRRFYELFNQAPVPLGTDPAATAAALQARFSSALLEEYHEIFLIAAGICLLAVAIAVATLSGGGRRPAQVAA